MIGKAMLITEPITPPHAPVVAYASSARFTDLLTFANSSNCAVTSGPFSATMAEQCKSPRTDPT
jgi:hypothetical protein